MWPSSGSESLVGHLHFLGWKVRCLPSVPTFGSAHGALCPFFDEAAALILNCRLHDREEQVTRGAEKYGRPCRHSQQKPSKEPPVSNVQARLFTGLHRPRCAKTRSCQQNLRHFPFVDATTRCAIAASRRHFLPNL
mmetsp:Transcript_77117/g.160548  ORF Transcript_77117/g.160548 Transcript_77117/m.160548 type:complete len:136 (+) Transcript_77117:184-591(+)